MLLPVTAQPGEPDQRSRWDGAVNSSRARGWRESVACPCSRPGGRRPQAAAGSQIKVTSTRPGGHNGEPRGTPTPIGADCWLAAQEPMPFLANRNSSTKRHADKCRVRIYRECAQIYRVLTSE